MPVETRPSAASRWTKCSAAPLFATRGTPQPESDAAREGTCAAWVAELTLTGRAVHCRDMIGECHANGWEVDAEMAGHIQGYVDMIRADGGDISTERFVRLSPLVAGTLDNAATFANGVLKVRDLKYGFRTVEADTEQLAIYAGALAVEIAARGEHVREVWTEIYQPRGFHPDGIHRRKCWTPQEIGALCKWIAQRAEECHKPHPTATPGAHCLDCDGASGCAALAATSANLIAMVEDARHRQMTPQEIAERLTFIRDAKKVIDAAVNAVEAEALAQHTAGNRIPGYGMKERLGHRKFTATREAIRAITGIDPVKEKDMTPAELKAAGASDRALAVLSHRPAIGHKLAKLDPRELARQFPRRNEDA